MAATRDPTRGAWPLVDTWNCNLPSGSPCTRDGWQGRPSRQQASLLFFRGTRGAPLALCVQHSRRSSASSEIAKPDEDRPDCPPDRKLPAPHSMAERSGSSPISPKNSWRRGMTSPCSQAATPAPPRSSSPGCEDRAPARSEGPGPDPAAHRDARESANARAAIRRPAFSCRRAALSVPEQLHGQDRDDACTVASILRS